MYWPVLFVLPYTTACGSKQVKVGDICNYIDLIFTVTQHSSEQEENKYYYKYTYIIKNTNNQSVLQSIQILFAFKYHTKFIKVVIVHATLATSGHLLVGLLTGLNRAVLHFYMQQFFCNTCWIHAYKYQLHMYLLQHCNQYYM